MANLFTDIGGFLTDGQSWRDMGSNAADLASNIGGFITDGQSWSDMRSHAVNHAQNISNAMGSGLSSVAGAASDRQFWVDTGNNLVDLSANVGGAVTDAQFWNDTLDNAQELGTNVVGFVSDEQSWADMRDNAIDQAIQFIPGTGIVDANTDFQQGNYFSGMVNLLTEIPGLKGFKSLKGLKKSQSTVTEGAQTVAKNTSEKVAKEAAEKEAQQNGVKITQDKTATNNRKQENKDNKDEGQPQVCDGKTEGCPISMFTGEELLQLSDFTIESAIPLTWTRLYRSSNSTMGGLGVGWTHVFCDRLSVTANTLTWHDDENRTVTFPLIKQNEEYFHCYERLTLSRPGNNTFCLTGADNICRRFSEVAPGQYVLLSLSDRDDNTVKLGYDHRQLLQTIYTLSEQGRRALYVIKRNNRHSITSIERVDVLTKKTVQTQVRYQYDEHDNLTLAKDAVNEGEQYTYNNHILIHRRLRSGIGIHFEWDQYTPEAKCLHQWGDNGYYDYRFTWEDDGDENSDGYNTASNGNGVTRKYKHNAQGRLIEEINGEGHRTRYVYNQHGWLTETIDPMGNCSYLHYDERGNVVESENPLGHTAQSVFDERGQLTVYTDPRGYQWQRQFNRDGNVSQLIDPLGATTQWYYNSRKQPTHILYENGEQECLSWNANKQLERSARLSKEGAVAQEYAYRYDDQGRVIAITYPDKHVEKLTYNALDQVICVERDHDITHYLYDGLGRLLLLKHADGCEEKLAYDSMGGVSAYQDKSGAITQWFYEDGLSQPTRRVNPDGSIFRYEYDSERNLTALVNENGDRHELVYDCNDQIIAERGFDGRCQYYRYNALGHLVHSCDEDGRELDYTRDALGQLSTLHDSDGSESTFKYNQTGALLEAQNAHSLIQFLYDPIGHVLQEQQGEAIIQHCYDELGRLTCTMTPDGQAIDYHYDLTGELTSVDYAGRNVSQFQRDELGRVVQQQQGGLTSYSEYDPQGRLTKMQSYKAVQSGLDQALPVLGRSYQYTQTGYVKAINDLTRGATEYHYDARERLVQVQGVTPERFAFDPASNLIDSQEPLNQSRTAQQTGNRLRFHGDKKYTYDRSGNLIKECRGKNGCRVTQFKYNAQNQLTHVDREGQRFEFDYDAVGRRIRKRDRFGETSFIWNGDVLLSEQRNNYQRTYLFLPDTFVPLAFIQDDAIYHYRTDHLGTPQEVANDDGDIVWQVCYQAYGNIAKVYAEQIDNPLRFQGQYYDTELGLHYNRHRYYDPSVGRYISQDPIGLLGGENSYAYGVNPIGWVDPFGLYNVSANTALQDVLSRGVHVNVQSGNVKPVHIGLRPDHQGGIKLTPEDPRAKAIMIKKPNEWKKIEASVNHYLDNPANANKLTMVANSAKQEYPHKAAEFAHLEKNLQSRTNKMTIKQCKEVG